ncbi:MAG: retroviral-like aspartic protease [Bacteroidales bacterium]|nr:retroviral-like aspartic protease [Bacteroidales bacterium]
MGVYVDQQESKVESIISPVAVCEAVELNENMDIPKVYRTMNCMWDTGSTNTLITQDIVDELGLEPYGRAVVSDNSMVEECDTYLVHIGLPTGNTVLNLEVLLTNSKDYDVVIGMDVITMGDFVLTNANGKSVFSFRYPAKEKIVLKS